jgi:hypothetical protein
MHLSTASRQQSSFGQAFTGCHSFSRRSFSALDRNAFGRRCVTRRLTMVRNSTTGKQL